MHKSGQDAFIGLCIVCLLLVAITAVASATTAEDEQLADIQNAIEEKGARWTAGKTAVSGLSAEEKELLFGLEIDSLPADIPVISPPTRLMAIPYGTFDWRNKDGQNWMTSVKNQGSCGSCWAFAAVGAVEAVINIERNDPDIDIDLSEQHLVSDCCAYCGNCGGGSPWYALDYIKYNGVPDEPCFSYQASNSSCTPCSDWQDRAWEIGNYGGIEPSTTAAYKWGLETYGPMIVVLRATDDFLYYTGGIYEPVLTEGWGAEPNHAVVLVGYNDTEQYWIIKNSWGLDSGWGEVGYVKVSYGVLEQYDYALVVDNTVGPAPSAPVVSSPTHPNESAWYCSGNVTFSWTTPPAPSGIACYSYTLDQSPTTTPDDTCDTTGNSKSYASLSDGTRYFHVRAKDNDGNWGSAGHYRVMIENCDVLDGWYCNGDIKELRDYYCSGGNCTFNVTESENCSASDEWVNTSNTRWVNDTACTEKEQQEQDYHDYFCAAGGNCSFTVIDTRWLDTGNTQNKPNGSDCGSDYVEEFLFYCSWDDVWKRQLFHDFYCDNGSCVDHTSWMNDQLVDNCSDNGVWEADPTNPCKERREIFTCVEGACLSSGEYEYLIKSNGTICDYGVWAADPTNPCKERRELMKCLNGTCTLSGEYEYRDKPDGSDCGIDDYYDAWETYCSGGDEIWQHRLFHDFYCDNGSCIDHTSWVEDQLVENCSESDGWVNTSNTRWVNDTACTEKEQLEQAYHDYFCAAGGNCSFSVTGTRWIETGTTRDKPQGSDCGCTANNTMMKCYNGTCSDTGMCNSTICQANAACDGKGPGEACGAGSTCNYNCECQEGSAAIFDTGQKVTPYPSIAGTHTGVLRPSKTLVVSKLYTYPCPGTGGHTEYARIWNSSWEGAEAHWEGYVEDWHNISFNETFTLLEGETYNYTIRTGSYPQMHLTNALQTPNGWINCTAFIDGNGKAYNDRIPAIRLA